MAKQKPNNQIKKHSYLIKPVNVMYRHPQEQESIYENFRKVIHAAKSDCIIDMYRDNEDVLIGDMAVGTTFNRIAITTQDDISGVLAQSGFEFEEKEELAQKILESGHDHTVLGNGMKMTCFSLYSMSANLNFGWAVELFSICDFVKIFIKHTPRAQYTRVFNTTQIKARAKSNAEMIDAISLVDVMRDRVMATNTGILLEVKVVAGILSNTVENIRAKSKEFKTASSSRLVEFHHVPFGSENAFKNGGPYNFLIESNSLYPFFPFYVSEIYEDGGIILGKNLDTGAPVKYNYAKRRNYNWSLVAPSGSGKSFLLKLVMTRMMNLYPDAFLFITDIENEYVDFGKKFGFSVVRTLPNTTLGLDPFNYMAPYKAAEIIANIVNAPEIVKNEMVALAEKCKSITDLYDQLVQSDERAIREQKRKEEFAIYLRHLTVEPISSMISGAPQFGNRTVLAMKDAAEVRGPLHRFATMLSLEYVLEKAMNLPRNIPKIVVLDEFWSAIAGTNESKLLEYAESIIRRGRKYNVMMMFATQNLSDVLENQKVKAMFENTATQILMGQKATEVDLLEEQLKLSAAEMEVLLGSGKGEAMIHADNNVVHAKFMVDEKEYSLFQTTPTEEQMAL